MEEISMVAAGCVKAVEHNRCTWMAVPAACACVDGSDSNRHMVEELPMPAACSCVDGMESWSHGVMGS
eukprot:8034769-Lingulodinium_polyedra.AAC.1